MELENERWIEEARMNLEEALDSEDWSTARAIVADIEEKGFDASGARRMMNLAMAEATFCKEHGVTGECEYCKQEEKDSETGKEIAKGTL